MRPTFVSTRGGGRPVGLEEALFQGLAPDGGLYLPVEIPRIDEALLHDLPDMDLAEVAARLTRVLLGGALSARECDHLARETFTFPIPLRTLERDLSVLELFHGPTLAFKDFGARFMARLMAHFRAGGGAPVTVLTATSGDTGGAVAHAFAGLPGIRVVILYPLGRVSPRQERQFATLGGNVEAVAVQGSFDDCQRLVKGAFGDPKLRTSLSLTSANSINVGRLLPQSIYYAWGWSRLAAQDRDVRPVFVAPSGNFGNLAAGLIATRMGVPAAGFVAATNRNRVFPDYLASGQFLPRPSVATPSSAMDVGDPSNIERIQAMFGGDTDALREMVEGSSHDDAQTLEAIRAARERWGYLVDPHTAVGLLAAAQARVRWPDRPGIVLSTAHPAKFPEAITSALGQEPELPPQLAAVMDLQPRFTVINPEPGVLRSLLRG